MHGPGSGAGVGDVVVVGQLLSLDGDRVGHVVDQVHTGKVLGLTGEELVIAHQRITSLAGIAVDLVHLRATFQQQLEDIVLSGDGGAVAPDQAVVDGDGVGLGAILILHFLVAGHDSGIVNPGAFLVGNDSAIAVDQLIQLVVGGSIGEAGIIEVVLQIGSSTDDQLAGGLRGLAGFGSSGSFHSCLSAFAGGVADDILLTASDQSKNHHNSQNSGQQFSHVHVFSSFLVFCLIPRGTPWRTRPNTTPVSMR